MWFLAPLLIAVVVLLSRGAPGSDPAAGVESGAERTVAAASGGSASPAVDVARPDELEPRHPEIGFRTRARLTEHYRKHGREFRVKRAGDYLRLAQVLRDRPRSDDVLAFVRNDAVTCKYDRASGAFVAYDSDGTLRTFFRPRDGEAYFERQKTRALEPAGSP